MRIITFTLAGFLLSAVTLTEAQRRPFGPVPPQPRRPPKPSPPGRPSTIPQFPVPSRPGEQDFPVEPGPRSEGGGRFPRPGGGGHNCGGRVCRVGQRCVPQEVHCVRAPCPPIYRCEHKKKPSPQPFLSFLEATFLKPRDMRLR
ncbi:uncharacterized protein LOC142790002 [Rhipicephalus microplus]|uniref:uncharacterized protein LOC142790002 n=1 Tax=Rhipicephalus microplus TaxID=6941 RepID=UPI003F6B1B1E